MMIVTVDNLATAEKPVSEDVLSQKTVEKKKTKSMTTDVYI